MFDYNKREEKKEGKKKWRGEGKKSKEKEEKKRQREVGVALVYLIHDISTPYGIFSFIHL